MFPIIFLIIVYLIVISRIVVLKAGPDSKIYAFILAIICIVFTCAAAWI